MPAVAVMKPNLVGEVIQIGGVTPVLKVSGLLRQLQPKGVVSQEHPPAGESPGRAESVKFFPHDRVDFDAPTHQEASGRISVAWAMASSTLIYSPRRSPARISSVVRSGRCGSSGAFSHSHWALISPFSAASRCAADSRGAKSGV